MTIDALGLGSAGDAQGWVMNRTISARLSILALSRGDLVGLLTIIVDTSRLTDGRSRLGRAMALHFTKLVP